MALGQRTKTGSGSTPARILAHAREAFNERGVTKVGIREIARELELSPGNVSYHFPTKDDLVLALVREVHAQNDAQVAAIEGPLDFAGLEAILRGIMRRDLENRWFFRDYVGLLTAIPALLPVHERMHRGREARVDVVLGRLVEAGLLERRRTEAALPALRQQVLTQVLFWLPSALLADPEGDPAQRLEVHARGALSLAWPYCTPSGARQLEALLFGRGR
ncbi:MAG: TetR/AcrR family transcriptional regulator [Anaeromyxobacter sp.]